MRPLQLLLLTGSLIAQVASASASSMRAGFACADITPEIGMERPGGYGKAVHKAFHDACKVRASVFDNGRKVVAIVGLDLLMIPRGLVLAARADIEKATGITGDAVLLCASHSHSSGPIGMVQPGEYDAAPDLVKRLAYAESSCADPRFLRRVQEAIVEAVTAAYRERRPARLGFGVGVEDKVSFNRRIRMKSGVTWTNPGTANPDIVEYAGPIDPQVGVIGA